MKQFGGRLGCLFLYLSLLTACPDAAFAATPAAPPLKLAIAGGSLYSTDIAINAVDGATTTAALAIDACQQGVIYVKPLGSSYLEDVTNAIFCPGRPDYYLLDSPPGVRAFTMLSFHNGASRSSYKMPALGAVTPTSPSTIGLAEALTNTERQQVRVLCGFTGFEGSLAVDVYGPDGELLTKSGPERVECAAPITLQTLKTQFQSGYVVVHNVSSGYPGFGATIYGAVVNSSPANGNARVYPFGDSGPH